MLLERNFLLSDWRRKERVDPGRIDDLMYKHVRVAGEPDQVVAWRRIARERDGTIIRVKAERKCRPDWKVIHQSCRDTDALVLMNEERLHFWNGRLVGASETRHRRDDDVLDLHQGTQVRTVCVA